MDSILLVEDEHALRAQAELAAARIQLIQAEQAEEAEQAGRASLAQWLGVSAADVRINAERVLMPPPTPAPPPPVTQHPLLEAVAVVSTSCGS